MTTKDNAARTLACIAIVGVILTNILLWEAVFAILRHAVLRP